MTTTCRRFTDKTALVTGAGGGIGLAIARRLASEGARLVVSDLDAAKLTATVDALHAGGAAEVLAYPCDVSNEGQVELCVGAAIARFGGLELIVNNAGLMEFKAIQDLTAHDWLKVLGVDLLGTAFFLRQAFLTMKPGGAVVNIASIHALQTEALAAPYAAAKAAVLSLTRTASIEGKPKGLRCNAILPGAIDTPMLWDNPNVKSGVEKIDKHDVGQPADITAAVAFLGSDDAAFITGAALNVDGGRLARL
jgi:NAD(P)-dependent dehydrogenase (short-subunit alcohol dehydrogenase family)